jgi:phage terminase small subunit
MCRRIARDAIRMDPVKETIRAARALTPKQRRFTELVLRGETKTSAYRQTYNTNTTPERTAIQACRVSKKPKVAAVLEQAQTAVISRIISRAQDLRAEVLQKLYDEATDRENPAHVRVQALHILAKTNVLGLMDPAQKPPVPETLEEIKRQ